MNGSAPAWEMPDLWINTSDIPGAGFPGEDLPEKQPCTWQLREEYDVISCVACSICIAVGLVYCFFGMCIFFYIFFWLRGTPGPIFSIDRGPKNG